MVTVLIRTLIIYFLLLLALRLTGKRQVGELEISELITTFMISELATSPIQDLSVPIIYSIIPIVFILCAEIILSFSAIKCKKLKKIFFGNPSFIIENGTLNQKELCRLRIGINEFLGELRQKDVSDISDIDYAILEQNGKLSVILKEEKQPLCKDDLKLISNNGGLAHAIITDGALNESNLKHAGKSKEWIEKYIIHHNLNIESIFLMTVTSNGKISIIYKEEK